ncbi:hypothetical protein O1611_g1095 [Lasiodiplodia mahajangana]|uniref:Uncharacterized protein n=1 Tax=Lasiodiplodia mahajangana TaxID=1108764 RepID=A0ACC2JZB1_9PEZI|nr:hypothetical protein O1611_g1095 [Lasiodiplodia mahajangana]
MRLCGIFLAITISGATALHQSVIAHPPGAVEMATPDLNIDNINNITETITKAPHPLKTVVPDKPAVEASASIMGLIVFSAAGLVLL